MEELRIPKSPFEINWPLGVYNNQKESFCELIQEQPGRIRKQQRLFLRKTRQGPLRYGWNTAKPIVWNPIVLPTETWSGVLCTLNYEIPQVVYFKFLIIFKCNMLALALLRIEIFFLPSLLLDKILTKTKILTNKSIPFIFK